MINNDILHSSSFLWPAWKTTHVAPRPTSTSVRGSDVQSLLFRPERAAALHSTQPRSRDSSQQRINHSAICVNRNANLSLPLSAANLNIWSAGVILFFPRALFTICTGLTESVQAGFNRTTRRVVCTVINGFSVMLNKQNWSLRSMKWLTAEFALESHARAWGGRGS